jgi:hypothetical protein
MADIKVNADQWDAISKDEQKKITEGLRSVGSIKAEDNFVADQGAPAFDADQGISILWDPLKDAKNILCDAAAGTAFAWCTANTAGLGLATCMAAAEAGRQACRNS